MNELYESIDISLSEFASISLDQMKSVRLMNRIDTKYIMPFEKVRDLLTHARDGYFVQCIDGKRIAGYHTVYLDTADKEMYLMHQTGRSVRQKVRIRTYMNSGESFLEVKNKNNHGRTKKKRIAIPSSSGLAANQTACEFVRSKSGYELSCLSPHVENNFQRITLVSRNLTERLTIDLGLSFHNIQTGKEAQISHAAIVELKRDGIAYSPMRDILLNLRVHGCGFSKYCFGSAVTDPSLRQNNLKEKILYVEKII